MVLPRDIPVSIWGQATPNEKISVSFSDQTKITYVDTDGKWIVKLDPLEANSNGTILLIIMLGSTILLVVNGFYLKQC